MKLFFDTETTGKADFRSPPSSAHQPRVVQLAALLTDDEGEEINSLSLLIEPQGFEIPAEASAIHGVTTSQALACGVQVRHALGLMDAMSRKAQHVIGHNVSFDLYMLDIEFTRCGLSNPLRNPVSFCTMHATTPLCKLPGNYGDYKWPKLQEAYRHAFGADFEGAHDAMADVRACARLYFWLLNQSKCTSMSSPSDSTKSCPTSTTRGGEATQTTNNSSTSAA